ncbi:hypothetical protein EAO71_37160 [Streptomyces sp. ms191]|uniref:hypothetical protein n=1 Tax=Streptomyces sp. ms191 TaxID=1827978 RepID=UPI0011CE0993|nr:hypothetical protein [Streptomyces sp. ms191]TXS08232.1 hypothetical protein EAO71_37160 [Streptomyces sp. ms191]
MPRIRLAYWHGDHQPGDEIEITPDELAALTLDGRVAEVLTSPPERPAPTAEVAEPPAEGRGRRTR